MLGKLSLAAIPYNSMIIMIAFGGMILFFLIFLILITYFGKWKLLWTEWFTSVDHKKIGVMFIVVALIMGFRGFIDSVMMRTHLALSYGASQGYLAPEHYSQVFTGHGVIMIFFMAMPFIMGLINIIVPLQIGARDMAFPFMNALSLWLLIAAAILVNISLGIGEFAKTGWVAYPPLSELPYSPGVGVDYYIWSLQIAGIGTLLSGINFVVTILKLRAPGMTLMKMPLFIWTALGTSILIIGAFPILTVDLALLALDRYLGMHFFTSTAGGNMMMYVNLFWAWGHPEVYILVLPAFGIFSEIVSCFSQKSLFSYSSMVYSTMAITIISYLVWLHHFFTMGGGGTVNAVFGIATMIIAIPTGVKIFNWLFTIYRGRLRFAIPMLWSLAFLITFVIGGMAGVMLAIPSADFVLHNSEFVVAHFHNVIIAGTIFGAIAGFTYWFPKVYGFTLNETLGKTGFWFFILGFYITFMPLYVLGFMGMTRRLYHYDIPAWKLPLFISACGVVFIGIAVFCLILQVIVSFIRQKHHLDVTGDPWNGRSLEWSRPSPVPHYNFAYIPSIDARDDFWVKKQNNRTYLRPETYHDILMPKNTSASFYIGALSLVFGFAMTWHIWWLSISSLLGILLTLLIRLSQDDIYYYIPVNEIKKIEEQHHQRMRANDDVRGHHAS
ncbi:cytochrome o ubiquinol oxidase subunit I [Legionella oakridgensis]|uniref:Cytochrome bo(3) ubiquinol oxidase subunit 1 n=2 Tax=Legionella oakridgensis TaxID=29423 RepID=W0BBQ5_9GAMM|nr:cytochrome o ubiquinol oxidase, subunit I [Legionella oakridgensis ATCC 33761 = DSM 21215]KTD43816.1 cytochrome o ubiquinol oxidase subunit I [Legionella oakridgensis]STY15982.1 cytochrome o ubiquinol oxidase subunit I [Legionella longbeachae]